MDSVCAVRAGEWGREVGIEDTSGPDGKAGLLQGPHPGCTLYTWSGVGRQSKKWLRVGHTQLLVKPSSKHFQIERYMGCL